MPNLLSNLRGTLLGHKPDLSDTGIERPPFRPVCFAGQGSLTDSWSHELGGHGWGNNELQNYVDDTDCSYLRSRSNTLHPGNQMVLCAHAEDHTGTFKSARLRSKFALRDGPDGAARGYLCARITAPVSGKSSNAITVAFRSTHSHIQVVHGLHSGCCRANPSHGQQMAKLTYSRLGTVVGKMGAVFIGESTMARTGTSTGCGRLSSRTWTGPRVMITGSLGARPQRSSCGISMAARS
jgi:hypothetical protein